MKYNFNRILINGCSHSAGSEIEGSGIGESHYNRENCFGAQIAKMCNVNNINLSLPGGSNDYIYRTTLLWCINNPHLVNDTLFLIHWTGPNRTEFFVDETIYDGFWQDETYDKKVGHVHPGYVWPGFTKKDQRRLIKASNIMFQYDTHWQINRYMNIIGLQTILKNYNARFIFRNAFECCNNDDNRFSDYYNLIDKETFIGIDDKGESFFEHCLNSGFSIEKQLLWHHGLDAHTYWANKIMKESISSLA